MNKLLLIIIGLALCACARHPKLEPDIHSEGEQLLADGVIAYQNDNFSSALQSFNRALSLYQSIDDTQGAQLARINVTETALAVNNFAVAENQLTVLKRQNALGFLDPSLNDRVILLEVKLLFQKHRYREALELIEPLLITLGEPGIATNKRFEWLATAARLEALIAKGTKRQWLKQFRALMSEDPELERPDYHIISKRIDAVIAAENRHYQQALALLHEALNYYRTQIDRRSIAACLEEIAGIEFHLQHGPQSLEYLTRALNIRVWLKDQYKKDEIQKIMALINGMR